MVQQVTFYYFFITFVPTFKLVHPLAQPSSSRHDLALQPLMYLHLGQVHVQWLVDLAIGRLSTRVHLGNFLLFFYHFFSDFQTGAPCHTTLVLETWPGILMRERPIPGPGACTLDKRSAHGKFFNKGALWSLDIYFLLLFYQLSNWCPLSDSLPFRDMTWHYNAY